jgi:hypothetical protein
MFKILKASKFVGLAVVILFACTFVVPTMSFAQAAADDSKKGAAVAPGAAGAAGGAGAGAGAGAAAGVGAGTIAGVAVGVAAVAAGIAAASGGGSGGGAAPTHTTPAHHSH